MNVQAQRWLVGSLASRGRHRKLWSVVALLVASVGVCLWSGRAQALAVPPLAARVNDLAQVLSPTEQTQLEARLEAHERSTGQQFALLTVPSLAGDSIEDFSMRVVEAWQLGSDQRDDGLLMVVAVQDRRMRIEVGYGLEGSIPDALAGRIVRDVLAPRFRTGDYGGGINAAFSALFQAAGGEPVTLPAREPEQNAPPAWVHWVWLLPLLVLLLSRRVRGGHSGAGMLLGGGGQAGRFGGGGGGFGGGGGGFGGGGASGSW